MSTNHTPEIITAAASEQIALLLNRQWPEISAIIEEEGEVKISASIHVTDREPEEGNHADKDRRVKTTISFSKKFSDSTEKALDDPNQPNLDFDGREEPEPDGYFRGPAGEVVDASLTTDETVGGDEETEERRFSGAEMPEEYELVKDGRSLTGDIALNVERTAWVTVASPGARWDEYHGLARKKGSAPKNKRPEGWAEAALKAGQTGVGDALTAAAAGVELPQVAFLENELSTSTGKAILKEWRRAAKKAGWPVACAETMTDILRKCDSPVTMMATLRPHLLPEDQQRKPVVQMRPVELPTLAPEAPAAEQNPFEMDKSPAAPVGAEVAAGGEVPDGYELPE